MYCQKGEKCSKFNVLSPKDVLCHRHPSGALYSDAYISVLSKAMNGQGVPE
jgi:hypothetical protein